MPIVPVWRTTGGPSNTFSNQASIHSAADAYDTRLQLEDLSRHRSSEPPSTSTRYSPVSRVDSLRRWSSLYEAEPVSVYLSYEGQHEGTSAERAPMDPASAPGTPAEKFWPARLALEAGCMPTDLRHGGRFELFRGSYDQSAGRLGFRS